MKADHPLAARHYPGPVASVVISFGAWMAAAGFIVILGGVGEGETLGIAEIGMGEALGLGLIASLAARHVPPPQPERLGLRGFSRSYALPLLLLLPVSILASELVNVAHAIFPPPDAQIALQRQLERLAMGTPLAALETAIVVVGLAPVVEEWLYRGVIQQGLVAQLGRWGGLLATSCLFGLAHFEPSLSVSTSLATFCAILPMGLVLGLVRLATGSLLAAILVHASYNGLNLAGLALADRLPLAGFNAPGAHTPPAVLALCALPVGLALSELLKRAREVPAVLPLPDRDPAAET